MLEYCWIDPRNQLQWNFNLYQNIFIQENAFECVVCEMASICLGLNVLSIETDSDVMKLKRSDLNPKLTCSKSLFIRSVGALNTIIPYYESSAGAIVIDGSEHRKHILRADVLHKVFFVYDLSITTFVNRFFSTINTKNCKIYFRGCVVNWSYSIT